MSNVIEQCDHGMPLWANCDECKAQKIEFPWSAAGVTGQTVPPDIGEEYAGEYVTGDSGDESDYKLGDRIIGPVERRVFGTNANPNLAELVKIGKIAEVMLKPTNPKDALGIKKVPFTTISWPVLAELGVAMLEGAMKYGRHNYRTIGVRASVYIDAANRHLASYWEGEDIDPDSGLSHVTKAIASLVVLRDAMINEKFTDDRPPRPPAGWMGRLNDAVSVLIKKYPNPVLPYTEVDNTWSEAAK